MQDLSSIGIQIQPLDSVGFIRTFVDIHDYNTYIRHNQQPIFSFFQRVVNFYNKIVNVWLFVPFVISSFFDVNLSSINNGSCNIYLLRYIAVWGSLFPRQISGVLVLGVRCGFGFDFGQRHTSFRARSDPSDRMPSGKMEMNFETFI